MYYYVTRVLCLIWFIRAWLFFLFLLLIERLEWKKFGNRCAIRCRALFIVKVNARVYVFPFYFHDNYYYYYCVRVIIISRVSRVINKIICFQIIIIAAQWTLHVSLRRCRRRLTRFFFVQVMMMAHIRSHDFNTIPPIALYYTYMPT